MDVFRVQYIRIYIKMFYNLNNYRDEIETTDNAIIPLIATIKTLLAALPNRIWKGFTDSDDSVMGHPWNLHIFAAKNNALDEDDEQSQMTFRIVSAQAFVMPQGICWDYGVNITLDFS